MTFASKANFHKAGSPTTRARRVKVRTPPRDALLPRSRPASGGVRPFDNRISNGRGPPIAAGRSCDPRTPQSISHNSFSITASQKAFVTACKSPFAQSARLSTCRAKP